MANFIGALSRTTASAADFERMSAESLGMISEPSPSRAFDVSASRALAGLTGPANGMQGFSRFGPQTVPQGPFGMPGAGPMLAGGFALQTVGAPIAAPYTVANPGGPVAPSAPSSGGGEIVVNLRPPEPEKEEPAEPVVNTTSVSGEVYKTKKDELIAGGYSEAEADEILEKVRTKAIEEAKKTSNTEKPKSADEKFAGLLESLPQKTGNANWQREFGRWYAEFLGKKGDEAKKLAEEVGFERVKTAAASASGEDSVIVSPSHVTQAKGLEAFKKVKATGDSSPEVIYYRDRDGKWYLGKDAEGNGTNPIADAFYDETEHRLYLKPTELKPREVGDATDIMHEMEVQEEPFNAATDQVKKEERETEVRRGTALDQRLEALVASPDKFTVTYNADGSYTIEYTGTKDDFDKLDLAGFNEAFSSLPAGTRMVFKFKKDSTDTEVPITTNDPYGAIYLKWLNATVPADKRVSPPAAPAAPPAAAGGGQ